VATPIRIEGLDAAGAKDLVEALAVRGLIGRAAAEGEGFLVELHEAHEDTERLADEVTAALELWLADRGLDSAQVRIGDEVRIVDASSDLVDTLRLRLSAEARPNAS